MDAVALDQGHLLAAVDLGAGHVPGNRVERLRVRVERGAGLGRIGVRAAVGVAGESRRAALAVLALGPVRDLEVVTRLGGRLGRVTAARARSTAGCHQQGEQETSSG